MALFETTFLSSQLFWTALSFLILLGIMWKYVVPAVAAVLDERALRIRMDLEKAEAMRADAHELLEQYQANLAQAKAEAAQLLAAAREQGDQLLTQRMAQLDRELQRKAAEAEAAIEAAKAQAQAQLQAQMADLVVVATRQVVRETVDEQRASAVATKVLKDLH